MSQPRTRSKSRGRKKSSKGRSKRLSEPSAIKGSSSAQIVDRQKSAVVSKTRTTTTTSRTKSPPSKKTVASKTTGARSRPSSDIGDGISQADSGTIHDTKPRVGRAVSEFRPRKERSTVTGTADDLSASKKKRKRPAASKRLISYETAPMNVGSGSMKKARKPELQLRVDEKEIDEKKSDDGILPPMSPLMKQATSEISLARGVGKLTVHYEQLASPIFKGWLTPLPPPDRPPKKEIELIFLKSPTKDAEYYSGSASAAEGSPIPPRKGAILATIKEVIENRDEGSEDDSSDDSIDSAAPEAAYLTVTVEFFKAGKQGKPGKMKEVSFNADLSVKSSLKKGKKVWIEWLKKSKVYQMVDPSEDDSESKEMSAKDIRARMTAIWIRFFGKRDPTSDFRNRIDMSSLFHASSDPYEAAKKRVYEAKSQAGMGLFWNKPFTDLIIAGLKCNEDFGLLCAIEFDPEMIICESDLICLFFEICTQECQLLMMQMAIEQRLPLRINYPVPQPDQSDEKSDEKCKVVLRDSLNWASFAKLNADGLTQTDIDRNKPLILSVGSSRVRGKSTLLSRIFDDISPFNIDQDSPIHKCSTDIVFLSARCKSKVHILDAHGSMDDPYSEWFSVVGKGLQRSEALAYLARLCKGVLIHVVEKDVKRKKMGTVSTISELISRSDENGNLLEFIKYLEKKNIPITLIIRDMGGAPELKPIEVGKSGQIFQLKSLLSVDQSRAIIIQSLRQWIDSKMSGRKIKWWSSISQLGRLMPSKHCSVFGGVTPHHYQQQMEKLARFRSAMRQILPTFKKASVNQLCPYIEGYRDFAMLHRRGKDTDELVVNCLRTGFPDLVKLFYFECIKLVGKWEDGRPPFLFAAKQTIMNEFLHERNQGKVVSERITVNDLVSNIKGIAEMCQAVLDGKVHYPDSGKSLKLFGKRKKFIKHLILSVDCIAADAFSNGIPVEFSDGDYSIIKERTMKILRNRFRNDRMFTSISVAGPQSSGKSTLLRRLFGIRAQASAGRTTRGINCSHVWTDDLDVAIIDTEGVGSVEKSSGSAGKDRRRDNKILLSALSTSRVFMLNILRDASFARELDVILWAHDKLTLGREGRTLKDIKFIFVIRDCEEFGDTDEWLRVQKAKINSELQDSLRLSGLFEGATEEEKQTLTIEDLVGEPIYFPMPSAFGTNGEPNPHFSVRARILREIILTSLKNATGKNVGNVTQWSVGLRVAWKHIMQFEDALSPADFKSQAHRSILRNQVNGMIDGLKKAARDKLLKLSKKILSDSTLTHPTRISMFRSESDSLITGLTLDPIQDLKSGNTDIDVSIKDEYILMFTTTVDHFKFDENSEFQRLSQEKSATVDLQNDIAEMLKEVILKLRESPDGLDEVILKRAYDQRFKLKKEEMIREVGDLESVGESLKRRLEKEYTKRILEQNAIHSHVPSSMKQLAPAFKDDEKPDYRLMHSSELRSAEPAPTARRSKWAFQLWSDVEVHTTKVDSFLEHSENWIEYFRILDETILDKFDQTPAHQKYRLTAACRGAVHKLAYDSLSEKLAKKAKDDYSKTMRSIEKMEKEEWEKFKAVIQGRKEFLAKAPDFADYCCDCIPHIVKVDWFDGRMKRIMDEWLEERNTTNMMAMLYHNAFGTGDARKAFRFVYHIKEVIKEHFDEELGLQKQRLMKDPVISMGEEEVTLEHVFAVKMEESMSEIIANLKKFAEKTSQSEEPDKDVSLQEIREQCVPKSPFKDMVDVDSIKMRDCKEFAERVIFLLEDRTVAPPEMIGEWIQSYFDSRSAVWHTQCAGCDDTCPFCKAKCMKPAGHSGPHMTNQHQLIAFTGTFRDVTNCLWVDVCTSPTNTVQRWDREQLLWPEYISKRHTSWDPIGQFDFDQIKVAQMMRCFFGTKDQRGPTLQDLILMERAKHGETHLNRATHADIFCLKDLEGYFEASDIPYYEAPPKPEERAVMLSATSVTADDFAAVAADEEPEMFGDAFLMD